MLLPALSLDHTMSSDGESSPSGQSDPLFSARIARSPYQTGQQGSLNERILQDEMAQIARKRNTNGVVNESNQKRRLDSKVGSSDSIETILGGSWGPNTQVEPGKNVDDAIRVMLSNGNTTSAPKYARNFAGAPDTSSILGMNADFSMQLLHEELKQNQHAAANAMLLAQITRNGAYNDIPGKGSYQAPFTGQFPGQDTFALQQTQHHMQHQQLKRQHQQQQHQLHQQFRQNVQQPYASLHSLAHFNQLRFPPQKSTYTPLLESQGFQQTSFASTLAHNTNLDGGPLKRDQSESQGKKLPFLQGEQPDNRSLIQRHLHVLDQESEKDFSKRLYFPLGIDEDSNWLSEFHCFVRVEMVEIFRASDADVKKRNNSIKKHQMGMRCRFCAHVTHNARTGRSSAFPSSLRQIYQSFTMMLRDHFISCESIPSATIQKFVHLKESPSQGATDSKRYWMYSAMKAGMVDSDNGIQMTQASQSIGAKLLPFCTDKVQKWEDEVYSSVSLVLPSDNMLVSEFLYVLLSQVQPIRLTESECIGNRRSLRVGLPGFGCRYCCKARRLGMCRMFPARRRTLPSKIKDIYDHLCRCSLCPSEVKDHLESHKRISVRNHPDFLADDGNDREFFDRVWSRLGHETQTA